MRMDPTSRPTSRLAPDLQVDGIAVLLACALYVLLAVVVGPVSMRRE
jgi:hypothetical protein